MKTNQTGGQAAIALLERYGVDTVFGIPGVHTLDLYRGLAESKIRHVAVRHEQGAGFLADGYARACAGARPPAACMTPPRTRRRSRPSPPSAARCAAPASCRRRWPTPIACSK